MKALFFLFHRSLCNVICSRFGTLKKSIATVWFVVNFIIILSVLTTIIIISVLHAPPQMHSILYSGRGTMDDSDLGGVTWFLLLLTLGIVSNAIQNGGMMFSPAEIDYLLPLPLPRIVIVAWKLRIFYWALCILMLFYSFFFTLTALLSSCSIPAALISAVAIVAYIALISNISIFLCSLVSRLPQRQRARAAILGATKRGACTLAITAIIYLITRNTSGLFGGTSVVSLTEEISHALLATISSPFCAVAHLLFAWAGGINRVQLSQFIVLCFCALLSSILPFSFPGNACEGRAPQVLDPVKGVRKHFRWFTALWRKRKSSPFPASLWLSVLGKSLFPGFPHPYWGYLVFILPCIFITKAIIDIPDFPPAIIPGLLVYFAIGFSGLGAPYFQEILTHAEILKTLPIKCGKLFLVSLVQLSGRTSIVLLIFAAFLLHFFPEQERAILAIALNIPAYLFLAHSLEAISVFIFPDFKDTMEATLRNSLLFWLSSMGAMPAIALITMFYFTNAPIVMIAVLPSLVNLAFAALAIKAIGSLLEEYEPA